MTLRSTALGLGISTIWTALGLVACSGQVELGHGTGTTRGALGQAPLANGTCNTGLAACSNVCVDTAIDLLNCGACGTACGPQALCSAGQCTLSTIANEECNVADVGAACSGGSTCIPATCCDDPNGCAPSDAGVGVNGAGSGSSGSSSSSGGTPGTGVSRACAVCVDVGGTYCPSSQMGMACAGGGTCGESGGGGGGPVTTPNGGTTTAAYGFSTCGGSNQSGSSSSGAGSSSSGAGTSSSSSGAGSSSSSGGFGSSTSSGGSVAVDAGAGSSSSSGG